MAVVKGLSQLDGVGSRFHRELHGGFDQLEGGGGRLCCCWSLREQHIKSRGRRRRERNGR